MEIFSILSQLLGDLDSIIFIHELVWLSFCFSNTSKMISWGEPKQAIHLMFCHRTNHAQQATVSVCHNCTACIRTRLHSIRTRLHSIRTRLDSIMTTLESIKTGPDIISTMLDTIRQWRSQTRAHPVWKVNIGIPKYRHPGWLYSRKNRHPDAYIYVSIGIRVPIFTVNMASRCENRHPMSILF